MNPEVMTMKSMLTDSCPAHRAWFAFTVTALVMACGCGSSNVESSPSAALCLEVQTRPVSPQRSSSYTRRIWDAGSRILTQKSATSTAFTEPASTLQWWYADEGRIIAYIGVEQPFQHDYRYDDYNNVSEFRLTYPSHPDLMAPSTDATWIGTSYDNQYSSVGRLLASTSMNFGGSGSEGPSQTIYAEDDAGRCQRIEVTFSSGQTSVELRAYDDAGRFSRSDTTQGTRTSHDEISYDDQGRVRSRSSTFDPDPSPGSFYASGMITTTYDYATDGSQTLNRLDTYTDVLDDQQVVTTRSPACQAIDDAIGQPADQRCRVR